MRRVLVVVSVGVLLGAAACSSDGGSQDEAEPAGSTPSTATTERAEVDDGSGDASPGETDEAAVAALTAHLVRTAGLDEADATCIAVAEQEAIAALLDDEGLTADELDLTPEALEAAGVAALQGDITDDTAAAVASASVECLGSPGAALAAHLPTDDPTAAACIDAELPPDAVEAATAEVILARAGILEGYEDPAALTDALGPLTGACPSVAAAAG